MAMVTSPAVLLAVWTAARRVQRLPAAGDAQMPSPGLGSAPSALVVTVSVSASADVAGTRNNNPNPSASPMTARRTTRARATLGLPAGSSQSGDMGIEQPRLTVYRPGETVSRRGVMSHAS